jgi:hypothetical protein
VPHALGSDSCSWAGALRKVNTLRLDRGRRLFKLFGILNQCRDQSTLAINLHKKLEQGLDAGIIAIIPVPESPSLSSWKCVLVDESMRKKTCYWAIIGGAPAEQKWNAIVILPFLGVRPDKYSSQSVSINDSYTTSTRCHGLVGDRHRTLTWHVLLHF